MALWHDRYIVVTDDLGMSEILVVIDGETKTTWRMPRELLKDLKRYALENDTNVTAVVLRACREFLAKDKMFKEKYRSHLVSVDK